MIDFHFINIIETDVFHKFVGKDKKWIKDNLISSDVEGFLSLYEAAHVRIRDECILDEAVAFTTHHLTLMLPKLESTLKEKVQQALKHSIHRSVSILNVRFYITIFERETIDDDDELVLKLAKSNFNFLQNIYRNELSQLSRWWNKFELKNKLSYARDRLVECYLWGTAICYEPQYSYARLEVTKRVVMLTIIDDTYDNYATLEEADLFTQILESWDMDGIDVLPNYMQTVYRFIMSIYEDYQIEAEKLGTSFLGQYYRETVTDLGRAYNQEQKWIMEGMPSFDEYMRNSIITSCVYIMFAALAPGMKSVTEESIQWLMNDTKIVISTAKIGRHMQDLSSHERENRDGKLPTVVDCYMKDKGASQEEALSKFSELLENGWKDVTAEWSKRQYSAPKEMVEQLLNYSRTTEITYKNNEDGYTNPEKCLASYIAALYMDPLLI